jgi:hypothetical protein
MEEEGFFNAILMAFDGFLNVFSRDILFICLKKL